MTPPYILNTTLLSPRSLGVLLTLLFFFAAPLLADAASASFTSSPACTISAGASTCNTTLDWTSSGVAGIDLKETPSCASTSYTLLTTTGVGSQSYATPVGYSSRCFHLFEAGTALSLASVSVAAPCASNSTWNGSICGQAELVPSAPTVSSLTVARGQTITLGTGSITNNGAVTAASAFKIGGFYLDNDGDGAADYVQATAQIPGGLVVGGSDSSSAVWTVPADAPLGAYRVSYIADSGNWVPESNEGNNFSGWTDFEVLPQVPSAPTNVVATPGACDTTSIDIAWDAIPEHVDTYTVFDGTQTTDYSGSVYPPDVEFTHWGVTPGDTYTYSVRAMNASGESYSTQVSAVAPGACTFVDLYAQYIDLQGTLTENKSHEVHVKVHNNGSVGTGVGFDTEVTYQWGGTSGAWLPMSGGTFTKSAFGPNEYAWDVVSSFTPDQTGTLYIQYCVDSGVGIGAVDEGVYETPNCLVSSFDIVGNSGCAAEVNGSCDLSATSHGGSDGACSLGYVGSCSLTCDNGNWIDDTNTCHLPVIDNYIVCTADYSSCVGEGGTQLVATGTPLKVVWESGESDACSPVSGDGFSTGDANTGEDDIVSSASINTVERYQVACNYQGGIPDSAWVDVVTFYTQPELNTVKTTVREGSTITLEWDTNNSDETSCSISGAGLDDSIFANGTGDVETGSVDVTIEGRTTFILTCGPQSDVKTIEVVPTGWEA